MKTLVMSAFILSTLTSAALAESQKPSTKTPVKLTDASGIPSFFTLISLANASASGSHVSRASSSTQNCQIHMIT
jgi:hypothetical protein